ncbi:MAG: helix-turn-helix domain-containing protein [Eubacterium sp.]|nr:helix-turn-helix domain-containing protein [Eubacterium sp.]
MRTVSEEDNIRKITLAAEMYYIYDMPQKEIAERLGVSRPWVSKLLKRAKEMGIVRIEINSPLVGVPEMEKRIRERYRINHVCVIRPLVGGDYTNISMAAANYLVSHLESRDVIGVSWGSSIARMIDHVVGMQLPGAMVVPIVGGAGSDADCLSNVNANRLSHALSAGCRLLHANAYCADQKEYQVVMSNLMNKEVIEQGEHCNVALVGIGGMKNSRVLGYDYVTHEDRDQIMASHVVGDVAFRFIDKGGDVADLDFNNRVVACNLSKIRRNAREVIAIAYGTEKAEAIKAVLKGGLLTTLFTDYNTAQLLTEM